MLLSIRKIFFNLKLALLFLGAGIVIIGIQIFHLSQYSDRLSALKNQHALIEKIFSVDFSDPAMANILVDGAISEITLSVKLSGREAILDTFVASNDEQASLLRSLELSSNAFCDSAMLWVQSNGNTKNVLFAQMMAAKTAYLNDINRMVDYQINIQSESIATVKMTVLMVILMGLVVFALYSRRMSQIYTDISSVSFMDSESEKHLFLTKEIDLIYKKIVKRSSTGAAATTGLIHPISGLANRQGLINLYNSKKTAKSSTNYLSLFQIDDIDRLSKELTSDDIGVLYNKLANVISLFEEPLDVSAHLEDDTVVFILARSSKKEAIEACENLVETFAKTPALLSTGTQKVTLSGGFLLKPPSQSLDAAIDEARKLLAIALENGGNKVAQLRPKGDMYH